MVRRSVFALRYNKAEVCQKRKCRFCAKINKSNKLASMPSGGGFFWSFGYYSVQKWLESRKSWSVAKTREKLLEKSWCAGGPKNQKSKLRKVADKELFAAAHCHYKIVLWIYFSMRYYTFVRWSNCDLNKMENTVGFFSSGPLSIKKKNRHFYSLLFLQTQKNNGWSLKIKPICTE